MRDFANWVFVLAGSRTFVGMFTPDDNLSPAYDMSVSATQAGGNMQIHRVCFPILLYHGIKSVKIPADAMVIYVTAVLSEMEQRDLATRIAGAEAMRESLRAKDARDNETAKELARQEAKES